MNKLEMIDEIRKILLLTIQENGGCKKQLESALDYLHLLEEQIWIS